MNENADSEKADADLMQFAAQFGEALPKLPPEALARVGQQLDAELKVQERRDRRRQWLLGLGVAASIALAILGYAASRSPHEPKTDEKEQPTLVRDRVRIVHNQAVRTADAGRPVIALDKHRSLYAD